MKSISFIVIFFTNLVLLAHSSSVNANLMISPLNVLFNERDRVETVSLINSSNETRTYRLMWKQQRISPQGQYVFMKNEDVGDFPIASPYLRFSPSQVTLGPGERQSIKIMLRKPNDLPDGDYRSHLNFVLLPPEVPAQDNQESSLGMQMRLNVMLSYSIPVVIREGAFNFQGQVDHIDIVSTPQEDDVNTTDILVKLSRVGTSGVSGRLEAFFTEQGTKEPQRVGLLNNFNFFPDVTTLTEKITWQNFDGLKPGTLEITYSDINSPGDAPLIVGKAIIE